MLQEVKLDTVEFGQISRWAEKRSYKAYIAEGETIKHRWYDKYQATAQRGGVLTLVRMEAKQELVQK